MHLFPRLLLPVASAVILLLVGTGRAVAQAGLAELRVVVTDTLAQPIAGAQVVVSGVAGPATSDSAGVAVATGIPFGTRIIAIRHPAYQEERAVLQLASPEPLQMSVVMAPAAMTLDTLLVVGERRVAALDRNGFYERRKQGLGKYFTRDAIERTPSGDLGPIFRQVLGFRVDYAPTGGSFRLRSSRGAISLRSSVCEPFIRIDGVPADMEQLSTLSPQHVEAIEAYPSVGAVPPQYANGLNPCGVVLVWLRR